MCHIASNFDIYRREVCVLVQLQRSNLGSGTAKSYPVGSAAADGDILLRGSRRDAEIRGPDKEIQKMVYVR